MVQKEKVPVDQLFYNNRWVDKCSFRAFVYGKNDEVQLAKNYEEFEKLLSSGLWFADKKADRVEVKEDHGKVYKLKRKAKDGSIS